MTRLGDRHHLTRHGVTETFITKYFSERARSGKCIASKRTSTGGNCKDLRQYQFFFGKRQQKHIFTDPEGFKKKQKTDDGMVLCTSNMDKLVTLVNSGFPSAASN